MANYVSGQYVYSSNDIATKITTVSPVNFPYPSDTQIKYQQIIIKLNEGSFSKGESYYIKLSMPRHENFDMEYILRGITTPEDNSGDLSAIQSYQMIKHIKVPSIIVNQNGYSTVILYQKKNNNEWETIEIEGEIVPNVHAAVLIEWNEEDLPNRNGYYNNKILHYQNKYYEYDNLQQQNYWREIDNFGKSEITLIHDWAYTETNQESSFEFIFTPTKANLDAIYLYLVPNTIDNNIRWTSNNTEYYGRHINPAEIECEIYSLTNIFEGTNKKYVNIGVWGRSELLLSIDGVEIKIGPSGYYELRDYEIESIAVAALGPQDKYTIDYQYKE